MLNIYQLESKVIFPIKLSKKYIGFTCATCVLFIWSSWIVASRYGVLSSMTIFDLIAIRFGVSGIIVIPFIIYYKPWRTLTIFKMIVYSALLGPIYMIFVFSGFIYAPASHSAVFFNGFLPFLTLLISFIWLKEKISKYQILAISLILLGAFLILLDGARLNIANSWFGDLIFLCAGTLFAAYIVVSRAWKITIPELLFCSSFINFIFYIPLWILFFPKNIVYVSNSELIIQLGFQGIVPNLIGLLLVTISVKHIGSGATSAFLAGVPAGATILSMLILNEFLGFQGWLGILSLTPGILMLTLMESNEAN